MCVTLKCVCVQTFEHVYDYHNLLALSSLYLIITLLTTQFSFTFFPRQIIKSFQFILSILGDGREAPRQSEDVEPSSRRHEPNSLTLPGCSCFQFPLYLTFNFLWKFLNFFDQSCEDGREWNINRKIFKFDLHYVNFWCPPSLSLYVSSNRVWFCLGRELFIKYKLVILSELGTHTERDFVANSILLSNQFPFSRRARELKIIIFAASFLPFLFYFARWVIER